MSFLQLVLSLDKTKDGFNSILPIVSFWPISQQGVHIVVGPFEVKSRFLLNNRNETKLKPANTNYICEKFVLIRYGNDLFLWHKVDNVDIKGVPKW